ncbi:SigE family RNA polymerase sigma factor [Streptomyces cadmiisoli]|uniref:SigE family RNA polymerase sigma factor n=1 Tax=Streptomyces cadmiisoli TaxID=2184053 RepID=A0A2Z4J054_9ACTN|nr:SigE family RNA polymerase sigma factor [Streptomyces cadmiisoli]AWW38377.1 SigE family RNA polymerase sigma factor [Streptomyces cadmiisoli]
MRSGWTEFEEFVDQCGPRLLRSAWLLTGDRHLAEDLLQTALARSWPKWRRIRDEQPEAYVRRVMMNVHASWWRRRWRGEVPHAALPEVVMPEDRYGDVDLERTVGQALRRLPARQRAVVVLRYLEDRSVEETAALLNCSAGTVKSQAAKALRTLRGTLPNPIGLGR